MVNGLETFRRYFKDYSRDYVLIGGVACELAMNRLQLEFRPTDDFDIVIVAENILQGYGRALKEFIRDGGYSVPLRESNGRPTFFRFLNPTREGFPAKLELATRKPIADWPWQLAPVDAGDAHSSLSAILFEPEFYQFIIDNAVLVNDISTLRLEGLIPSKCLAYLELKKKTNPSEKIRANMEKHLLDVFRLADVLPDGTFPVPEMVASAIRDMLTQLAELSLTTDQLSLVNMLRTFYQLG
jgi:hypothetical protein